MVAHMSIGVHSPELVRCQGPGPLHLVLCCDNGNGQGWLPPPLVDEDREEVQGDTHVPPEEHAPLTSAHVLLTRFSHVATLAVRDVKKNNFS